MTSQPATAQQPVSPSPSVKHSRLDVYHKAVCPTIALVLTAFGITAAWLVFGIQAQTAERSKRELEHRIEKLDEFNKRLEQQNKALTEQQKRLEDTIQTGNARERDRLNKSVEMYDLAADLYKQAQKQGEKDFSQTKLHILSAHTTLDNIIGTVNTQVAQSVPLHQSILILAQLQAKSPIYTQEERALIKSLVDISTTHIEALVSYPRYHKEFQDACEKLSADYAKAAKEAKDAPLALRAALVLNYMNRRQVEMERLKTRLEKSLSNPNERLKQLDAAQSELLKKLNTGANQQK